MKINRQRTKPVHAIVFDFDATLMDTEEIWYQSDKRLLAECGIELTVEMKNKYIGKSLGFMVKDLIENYGLTMAEEEMKQKKNRYFLEIAEGSVSMFPEMQKVYTALKGLNLPMAIATGTEFSTAKKILTRHNMFNDFEFILTAAEVPRGKPAPDIYVESARRLHIEPEHILVLEDSSYGVESAILAGCMCIGIPYILDHRLEDIFYQADILVEQGMRDLEAGPILSWIK